MKTHELAKILLSHPDMEIVLQKDEEANGFKQFRGADFDAVFDRDNCEAYPRDWTADDVGMEEEEWEAIKASAPVVIFYP